ncbi:MAG: hypothetical protein OXH52_18480 [Gammaproteobacteria bacterium]|nr:hypothetical protein [Gammaproteobacteria bacterium]
MSPTYGSAGLAISGLRANRLISTTSIQAALSLSNRPAANATAARNPDSVISTTVSGVSLSRNRLGAIARRGLCPPSASIPDTEKSSAAYRLRYPKWTAR